MFTGIVEEVGRVKRVEGTRLTFSAGVVLEGTRPGDSIAVNGACLTAVELTPHSFTVDVTPETLRRTNLGGLRPGVPVNLERPLAANGRLGGHFVQGHVDDTGRLAALQPEGDSLLATIEAPEALMRYIVEKGYVAVDGASLTAFNCTARSFQVALVQYTQTHATLAGLPLGAPVNLEVDMIGKYVEKLLAGRSRT